MEPPFRIFEKQYQAGNEKLYLKQKYDTASLFNIASRMFAVMTRYDSIDAEPDKKGRVRPKMRKPNSSTLNSLRPNLFNGGIFFIGKSDYSKAYTLLDQYVSAAEMPISNLTTIPQKTRTCQRLLIGLLIADTSSTMRKGASQHLFGS